MSHPISQSTSINGLSTSGTVLGVGVTGEKKQTCPLRSTVWQRGWMWVAGGGWQGRYQKRVVPWAHLPKVSGRLGPQPAVIPLEREKGTFQA